MTTAAEMRDALLEELCNCTGDDEHDEMCAATLRSEDLDALIAKVEAETRAGLVEALEAVVEVSDGLWVISGYRERWQEVERKVHAALAALPAPEPSSGAAPVEERCVWEWKGDGGGPCDLPEESFPHPCQHDPHEPWDMCHPFTPAPRSAGAGDGRTER